MFASAGAEQADLIASLTASDPQALAALPPSVGILELRADLAGDPPAAALRSCFGGRLIYSWRATTPVAERHCRLIAADRFDFVELDAERDLLPDILAAVAPERRIIAWHGPAEDAASLARRFAAMAAVPAALYRLEPRVSRFADAFAPLHLLRSLGRRDVLCFADGIAGLWTRPVAALLGARVVVGTVDAASGAPTIARLIEDFGLPDLPPAKTICGIVGAGVPRSASPRLHNAAYRKERRAALFLPFPDAGIEEVASGVERFEALGFAVGGLTVTAPFKEAALALADRRSPAALASGAANLLVHRAGGWLADTTGPGGVLDALAARGIPLEGREAAVLGCGGAGMAAAVALDAAGAGVTLVNRNVARGRAAARRLGLPFVPIAEFDPAQYGLVVNATPLGGDAAGRPFDPARLHADAVVIDLVYGPRETPLVAGARARGLATIDGLDILHREVRHQYRRMTGLDPVAVAGHRAPAFIEEVI
jgi:3-dehydroquinate dehydratase/shikimate dehydrogenase